MEEFLIGSMQYFSLRLQLVVIFYFVNFAG